MGCCIYSLDKQDLKVIFIILIDSKCVDLKQSHRKTLPQFSARHLGSSALAMLSGRNLSQPFAKCKLFTESNKLESSRSKSKSDDLNACFILKKKNLSQSSLLGAGLTNTNTRNMRVRSISSNAYFTEEDILKSSGTNFLNHPNNKDLYNNIKPEAMSAADYCVSLNSLHEGGFFLKNSSISVLDTYNCQTPVFSKANCIEYTYHPLTKNQNIISYSDRLNYRREWMTGQISNARTNREKSRSIKFKSDKFYEILIQDERPSVSNALSIKRNQRVKSKFDTINDIISGARKQT